MPYRVEKPVPDGLLVVPRLQPGLEVGQERLVVREDLRDLEEDVVHQDVAHDLVRLVLQALQRTVVPLQATELK